MLFLLPKINTWGFQFYKNENAIKAVKKKKSKLVKSVNLFFYEELMLLATAKISYDLIIYSKSQSRLVFIHNTAVSFLFNWIQISIIYMLWG